MTDIWNIGNFGEGKSISSYSSAELVMRLKQFNVSVSTWMLDLAGNLDNVNPAPVDMRTAHNELMKRKKERDVSQPAKCFVEQCVTERKLVVEVEEKLNGNNIMLQTIGKTSEYELQYVGGHILKKDISELSKGQVATENLIDIVNFSITSDPKVDSKGKQVSCMVVVPKEAADALKMPLYDTVRVFPTGNRRDIEYTIRKKANETVREHGKVNEVAFKQILSAMDLKIKGSPTGKMMEWTGLQLTCPLPRIKPEKINSRMFYEILEMHRRYRGTDSGYRAKCSIGYYFGYMPVSLYRTAYIVSDMMRIAQINGNKSLNLEINSVDGVFSSTTLYSLVANGWIVRVINGFSFPKAEKKPGPGIYSSVQFEGLTYVYTPLSEPPPIFSKKELVLHDVSDRLTEMVTSSKDSSRVAFSYVYLRDDLSNFVKHILPSSHAHNGHAIFVSCELSKEAVVSDMLQRALDANAFKSSHVFNRMIYLKHDPMAYFGKFVLFTKAEMELKDQKSYTIEVEPMFMEIPKESVIMIEGDHKKILENLSLPVEKRDKGLVDKVEQDQLLDSQAFELFTDPDPDTGPKYVVESQDFSLL